MAEPAPQVAAPGGSRDAFFFLHIPKTAGQSLRALLDAYFEPGEICRAAEWEQLLAIPRAQLAEYRYFRGHLAGDMARFLGRSLRQFTFLRNPVARAISHYANSVRSPTAQFHREVRKLGSLSACIRDPELQHYLFSNVQAAYVGDDRLPGEPGHGFLTGLSEDELLARARRRLEAMACVGVTERFRDSVVALCHVFEWDLPLRVVHRNPSPSRDVAEPPTQADLELLASINRVDLALCDHAERRLNAVLAQMKEERRREPERWRAREERRLARLEAMVERQASLLAEYERERNSLGGRLGRRLQRQADRLFPPGSSLRTRLGNWLHGRRPRPMPR